MRVERFVKFAWRRKDVWCSKAISAQVMVVGARSGPGELQLCELPWPAHPVGPVCFSCAAGVPLPAWFHLKAICSVLGSCTVSGALWLQKHTATSNLNTGVMGGAGEYSECIVSRYRCWQQWSWKQWESRGPGHQRRSPGAVMPYKPCKKEKGRLIHWLMQASVGKVGAYLKCTVI